MDTRNKSMQSGSVMGVRVQRDANELLGVGWRVAREVGLRREAVGSSSRSSGVEEYKVVGRWWWRGVGILDISRVHKNKSLETFC
jgi:hypothetical protein